MYPFNKKIVSVEFSGIASIVNDANKLGDKVIRLEVGDVDYDAPIDVKIAVNKAINQNFTHYPPASGNEKLIDELIQRELYLYGKRISRENIYVTSGGSLGVYLSMQTILNSGDEIIVFEPAWPHFIEMAKLCGANVQRVSLSSENGFHIDEAVLEEIDISAKTKAILINTPNNPTGAILSEYELELIYEFATANNLHVICDEEYNSFCYTASFSTLPSVKNSVVVRSFSKSYAIAGLRLGYVIGDEEWIKQIKKWGLFSCMYSSSIIQQGLSEALPRCDNFVYQMQDMFKRRADLFYQKVSRDGRYVFSKPEGSVYFWLDCREFIQDDVEFSKDLLYEKRIAVVPGSCFGESGSGFIRISLGARIDDLLYAAETIINELERHKNVRLNM